MPGAAAATDNSAIEQRSRSTATLSPGKVGDASRNADVDRRAAVAAVPGLARAVADEAVLRPRHTSQCRPAS
jgi:hypothetical protein